MFAATARFAGIVFAGLLFAASAASAQETMKGGTITYAKPGEMISLDPHTSISGVDWRILYQIYEQLLSVNDDFTFGPGLATSWEQPAPTTYIFHLNKDSKFSNGRTVVASDVVGSLERVLNPETAAFWAVQLGKVKEIVADDDHTVRVELEVPHTPFPSSESCLAGSPSYTTPRAERLEQARALLAEAGYDGSPVELIASPIFPAFPLIAQVMQKNLADIGMEVEIKQLLQAEWYDAVFAGKSEFDFAISYFAGYSDPAMVLAWWDPVASVWNRHFVETIPELNDLLAQTRVTPSGDAREAQFKRICELIDDSANMLAIATKNDIVAYRHDQVSVEINRMEGNLDTLKFIEEFARLK